MGENTVRQVGFVTVRQYHRGIEVQIFGVGAWWCCYHPGGCWATTTRLLPRAFHFFSVRQILFLHIFNYFQPQISNSALGKALPYVTMTATFLYCPSGVFNNLRSPNFVPGLDDNENAMVCDCHPTCTDVSYSTEISESNFFKSEYDQTNFLWAKSLASIETTFIWYWTLYNFNFRVFLS